MIMFMIFFNVTVLFVCIHSPRESLEADLLSLPLSAHLWGHAELVSVTFRQLQAIQTGYQPLADSLCVSRCFTHWVDLTQMSLSSQTSILLEVRHGGANKYVGRM